VLGLLHVLIRDDLVDHDYIARHAEGFDDLARHVADWTPARVADVCGLDAADIERLARLYGTTSPAFIRTLIGAEHQEHGAMFFRALACLPVVTGSWRHRGGGLARSVGAWFDTNVDDSVFDPVRVPGAPVPRAVQMNHLGRLLTDPEAGVHALVVWNGNPAVSAPNAGAVRAGLARDDLFTVVSEQFLTDTARYADVVFPATTQLEQLDVVPAWGHLHLGWNEPAVAPLGEAVPNTELWRRLARAMGIDDPLFHLDDEALVRLALHDVDVDTLRRQGWVRLGVPGDLRPYADGGFATPSGKAALRSAALAAAGHPALPTHLEPVEDGRGLDAPLHLLTPKTHPRFLNSTYSAHHGPLEDGPYVELSAEDAAARGLAEADLAEVRNHRGVLVLPVRVSRRVRPGVAAVPWGWWGDHQAVNVLTSDTLADWGGGVAFNDTRVEVVAAAP
jgi:anaerobic selenocysteine-containing dehydrogenase